MIDNFSALFYVKRVVFFALKEPIKLEILQILSAQVKIQNSCHLRKNKSEFLKILHHFSLPRDITHL